jgi:cytochrome c556
MRRLTLLAAASLFLVPATAIPQEPAVKLSRPELMKQKLIAAEKVLEGLALEDFDAISKHSQRLSLLTLEESWNALSTPDYRRESEEFRRAADALTDAARKKNLDGSALAYMQVTMKCVTCHKYVRSQK